MRGLSALGRGLAGCLMLLAASGAPAGGEAGADEVFATVGGIVITVAEFEANFHAGVRERFYHGDVPAAELAAFRREVGEQMIDRLLLLQEADRRGLEPDEEAVARELGRRAEALARMPDPALARRLLRERLLADNVIEQLRAEVEDVATPDLDAARAYWESHPERFTTPERLRLSVILLKVEPWADESIWQAALAEAAGLVGRLREGRAQFGDLATLHSADASAADGGDLGFVHRGMLSREAQEAVDALEPGEISEPVRMLQGVGIFGLAERSAPERNAFAQVRERARKLLHREQRARAWEEVLGELRRQTAITINEALLDGA